MSRILREHSFGVLVSSEAVGVFLVLDQFYGY